MDDGQSDGLRSRAGETINLVLWKLSLFNRVKLCSRPKFLEINRKLGDLRFVQRRLDVGSGRIRANCRRFEAAGELLRVFGRPLENKE